MKENSIKNLIIKFLNNQKDWVFGGSIEDYIREMVGAKASNASRRCRELENDGRIEKRYVNFEGKLVVQYRIKPLIVLPNPHKEPKKLEATLKLF